MLWRGTRRQLMVLLLLLLLLLLLRGLTLLAAVERVVKMQHVMMTMTMRWWMVERLRFPLAAAESSASTPLKMKRTMKKMMKMMVVEQVGEEKERCRCFQCPLAAAAGAEQRGRWRRLVKGEKKKSNTRKFN